MLLVVSLSLVGSWCETTVPPVHRGCEGYQASRGLLPQDEWWRGGPPRGAPAFWRVAPVFLCERRTAVPAGAMLGGLSALLKLPIAAGDAHGSTWISAVISSREPILQACCALTTRRVQSYRDTAKAAVHSLSTAASRQRPLLKPIQLCGQR